MSALRRIGTAFSRGVLLFFAVIALAWAGTTFVDYLAALAQRESSMKPSVINGYGYVGLFQMGEAALQDIGVYAGDNTTANDWKGQWSGKYGATSRTAFLSDPDAQIKAETAYLNLVWNNYLAPQGAADYIGQTIGGVTVTQSGLMAAAHLVGANKVLAWLQSGGTVLPADGNGTTVLNYMQSFGGYSVNNNQAPTYNALLAATPSGGAGVPAVSTGSVTQAPTAYSTGTVLGNPIATPTYATPAEGFAGASGHQTTDVRTLITLIIGALILLWFGNTLISSWSGYANGTATLPDLHANVVRGAIVVMLFMCLVW